MKTMIYFILSVLLGTLLFSIDLITVQLCWKGFPLNFVEICKMAAMPYGYINFQNGLIDLLFWILVGFIVIAIHLIFQKLSRQRKIFQKSMIFVYPLGLILLSLVVNNSCSGISGIFCPNEDRGFPFPYINTDIQNDYQKPFSFIFFGIDYIFWFVVSISAISVFRKIQHLRKEVTTLGWREILKFTKVKFFLFLTLFLGNFLFALLFHGSYIPWLFFPIDLSYLLEGLFTVTIQDFGHCLFPKCDLVAFLIALTIGACVYYFLSCLIVWLYKNTDKARKGE